jgi:hypothetical protein
MKSYNEKSPKYQSNWIMKYYDLFYLVVNLKSLPYFSTFILHNSSNVFYTCVYFFRGINLE